MSEQTVVRREVVLHGIETSLVRLTVQPHGLSGGGAEEYIECPCGWATFETSDLAALRFHYAHCSKAQ